VRDFKDCLENKTNFQISITKNDLYFGFWDGKKNQTIDQVDKTNLSFF
jgi:hypothetical protein